MDAIIALLALATIAAQIFVVVSLAGWIFNAERGKILSFISHRRLMLAFTVALAATLGSLFFSEIAGFEPCELCWFQRIFMYPQAVILAIALWKRDESVAKYILSLSGIGFLFSVYNIYIQQINPPAACSIAGPSCDIIEFVKYGYVTIPVMAFSAFIVLMTLFTIYREKE